MRRKSITSEMMKKYMVESLFQLLSQKKFSEITISEIVLRAGVNRSTYYRHFYQKEDIIYYFLDNVMKQYVSQIKPNVDTLTYLENMFRYFVSYRSELLLIYDNGLSSILLNVLNQYLGIAGCNKDNFMLEQYKTAYHIGGIFNYYLLWFSRRMIDSPEEMVKSIIEIFPKDFKPFLLR